MAGGLVCLLLVACGADERGRADDAPATAAVDWRSTTYELTCDGVVPGGFRARVVDGTAIVPAEGTRPPHYDHYEVRVVDTAAGDLDGDGGDETVVLLECSPQPSNGILQEVLVYASPGRLLGSLPSPLTLQGEAPLPPVHERIVGAGRPDRRGHVGLRGHGFPCQRSLGAVHRPLRSRPVGGRAGLPVVTTRKRTGTP